MLEIKGKVNTAVCYAKVVEDEAIQQIQRMCDYARQRIAGSELCRTFMPGRDVRLAQQ